MGFSKALAQLLATQLWKLSDNCVKGTIAGNGEFVPVRRDALGYDVSAGVGLKEDVMCR